MKVSTFQLPTPEKKPHKHRNNFRSRCQRGSLLLSICQTLRTQLSVTFSAGGSRISFRAWPEPSRSASTIFVCFSHCLHTLVILRNWQKNIHIWIIPINLRWNSCRGRKKNLRGNVCGGDERTDAYSPVQLEEADCANSRLFVASFYSLAPLFLSLSLFFFLVHFPQPLFGIRRCVAILFFFFPFLNTSYTKQDGIEEIFRSVTSLARFASVFFFFYSPRNAP